MMAKKKEEYDWISDPFKENPEQHGEQKMGSGSKLAIGCGCLLALVGVVVLFVMFFSSLASVASV